MATSQDSKGSNGLAITGFVLAIVAMVLFWLPIISQILWLLGLIFSIIGLKKSKEVDAGKGLAKAGVIISIVGAVIWVLFIVLGFFGMNFLESLAEEIEDLVEANRRAANANK